MGYILLQGYNSLEMPMQQEAEVKIWLPCKNHARHFTGIYSYGCLHNYVKLEITQEIAKTENILMAKTNNAYHLFQTTVEKG